MPSGAKITEDLLSRPSGATMDEIITATGGPQYNVLRRLAARGWRIRKAKVGRSTRYFAAPPAEALTATVTAKGQVTLPRRVRERLGVKAGDTMKFALHEKDAAAQIVSARPGIGALRGILPRPKRALTVEEMDEAIRQAVVRRNK